MSQQTQFSIAITIVSVLALAGCSNPEAVVVNEPAKVVPNVTTVSAPSQALPEETLPEEQPEEEEDLSFANEVDFFALPSTAPVRKSIASTEPIRHDTVRLLGVINTNPSDPSGKKALLKIGEHLVPVGTDDSAHGVTVLSIENRTVTLQRDRDRWTLAMFDQKIVNRAVAPPIVQRNRTPQVTATRNDDPLLASEPPFVDPVEDLPDPEAWFPPEPMLPEPEDELPLDLGLDLPGLEELQGLPGLPQI